MAVVVLSKIDHAKTSAANTSHTDLLVTLKTMMMCGHELWRITIVFKKCTDSQVIMRAQTGTCVQCICTTDSYVRTGKRAHANCMYTQPKRPLSHKL